MTSRRITQTYHLDVVSEWVVAEAEVVAGAAAALAEVEVRAAALAGVEAVAAVSVPIRNPQRKMKQRFSAPSRQG
jgi:hypothetical protein